jgi:hypothetical protein
VGGWILLARLLGSIICAVLFWFGVVCAEERKGVVMDREGGATTTAVRTEVEESSGQVPLEWIDEILENQEMLESMELLEILDLFEGESRFSPHHFE